jgi:hypothetical protein
MAFKMIKTTTIVLLALFNNQFSSSLVNASYNRVGEGLVRIELERKEIPHHDNVQLHDTVNINKMLQFDKTGDPLND